MRKVQYTIDVSKQALEDLWVTCFPEDADGFSAAFLRDYFRPEQGVCIVEKGEVQSALYMLPCTYQMGEKSGSLVYIYAMCTHPDHRRKGNLGRMLAFAEQHCKDRQIDGIILHALHTSKHVVETFGMQPVMTLGENHFTLPEPQAALEPCAPFETFRALRRAYLESMQSYVAWAPSELKFMYDDLCLQGRLLFFREADGLHYGIVSPKEGGWKIEETDCLTGLLKRLSGTVAATIPGTGVYGAHGKFYEKSLQEQACKLYFNLMMQ